MPLASNTETNEYELEEGRGEPQNQVEPRNRVRLQSFIEQHGAPRIKVSTKSRAKNLCVQFCDKLTWVMILNAILDRIPIIRCLKEYKIRSYLLGDIISGITVAIMHIPQGMAYGILTTLPPVYGLYVSFFPVIVYMIFGTCYQLSIGTFAVISLMTAQALEGVPIDMTTITSNKSSLMTNNTDDLILVEKVGIATTLAFLVGSVQLILSFLQLGFLTVYLTEPFISGFTTGAAIHVFTSQVPAMFGVKSPRDIQGAFKLPRTYVKLVGTIISSINWIATAVGFFSLIALYVAKLASEKYKAKLPFVMPNELILVIIGTLVSYLTKFETKHGVPVVGPIKPGLPPPTAPPFTYISSLITPAITIGVVALCISISMGKMFSRKHGYKVRSNQELLAYGMANVVSSFFQCYPSACSLSRSVVQEGSGCKTQLVGAFSCILLGLVILVLTPLFRSLPSACLAAIILVNLKGLLLQVKDFLFYFRISKLESILWLITFVVTICFDVDIGLYAGLATSFLINTIRTQKPRFVILGQIGDTEIYKNIKLFRSAQQFPNIRILRFDESLYACNAPFFKRRFYELIGIDLRQAPLIPDKKSQAREVPKETFKYVILDCSPFNFIDTVGVKLLLEIYNDLKKRDIQLYLTECRYGVRRTLERMNFHEKACRIIYVTTHDAVVFAKTALAKESIPSRPSSSVF